MKKKLTYILGIITFMLFPLMASASTKVELKETKTGEINSTIHFEEGFVGGIDLSIKVTGDIKVEKFNFNNEFTKNNYTTYYNYNKNILTIKITTGGISQKHNLLNKDKEVSLGKIILSPTSKEKTNYSLEATNLTIINNNWQSVEVEEFTTPTKDFTYQITNESSTNTSNNQDNNKDNKDDNETKNDSQNNDSTNKNETDSNNLDNKDTSSNKETSNNIKDNTSSNNTENNQNENDEQSNNSENKLNETENNETDNDSKETQNDTKKEETKEEKSLNIKNILIILGIGIVIIAGIIFFITKIKNK